MNSSNRWNRWRLSGLDDSNAGHAPTIRLVLSVRLWDDHTALDDLRRRDAWRAIASRMDSMNIPTDEGRNPLKLWSSPPLNDARIHELAPAPRELCRAAEGLRAWIMTAEAHQAASVLGRNRDPWWLEIEMGSRSQTIPIRIGEIGCWASQEGLAYLYLDLELVDRPKSKQHADVDAVTLRSYLDALHSTRFLYEKGAKLWSETTVDPRSGRTEPRRMLLSGGSDWQGTGTNGHFRLETSIRCITDSLFELVTGRPRKERTDACLENPTTLRAYAFLDVCSEADSSMSEAHHHELVRQIAEMAPPDREIGRALLLDGSDLSVLAYPYSEGAYFACTSECTTFVSINRPRNDFWCNAMPSHVLREYFTIQLLTMYQRHIVDEVRRLAGATDAFDTSIEERNRHWEAVQERAIRAKAHGFFIEVSMRTNHTKFEAQLRRVLHVDRAYELAMGLVDALCETQIARVEMRREAATRRREQLWQWIAGATIFPTIALTVLNVNMNGLTVDKEGMSLQNVLLLTVLFIALGFGLTWVLTRMQQKR